MNQMTVGLPNLVNARAQRMVVMQSSVSTPSRLRSFFAPMFAFLPVSATMRSFTRWAGGVASSAPVNASNSYSGVAITPELTLTLSAVWGCVWRYANVISTLPLNVMQSGEQNSATVARAHPLYTVLHDRPNIAMSSATFWKAMIASMMTWGACYARKLFSNGVLVGLRPLRPEFMTTFMGEDGELRYKYATGGNVPVAEEFTAAELFVVIDRSMDGYTGLSRIQYASNSFGLAVGAERAASLAFRNGLRVSGILTIAAWLKPDQRAAYKAILDEFSGTGSGASSDKQYGVMVAENATKFEPISMKPHDVELLASRRFSVEDVCRWYDVPPILIGHSPEGQTMWGTGVEQLMLGWLKLGLRPLLVTIEQEIWRQLFTPAEQGSGLFAEFNLEGLLRGDSAARASFYSQMSQNGVYTRNEIRSRENLPPMTGGDELTVQSNMTTLDKVGGTIPPPPPSNGVPVNGT